MKLGRYEVVRELGKGAMGVVYLAKDPLIGRLVALKTIRTSAHAEDDEAKEFQQRFIREAQAAGILNHPAIVTVHDIGQDDGTGTNFIAMEYVEGQNLKEILAQGRALTFEQIGEIIAQIADALDFAHAKGIVHRDVKPANIILVEANRAKITDFGIAKIASSQANLTTTGQFLGTPNYMAPEQIKGSSVDGRTDLFSLGICLYELLTRRKPFGGDSLTTISYKIVHESFPALREINPQIPEGFEDVVAKCLAKDPTKRYQRGRDLAAALRVAARGERPVTNDPVLADETIITRDRIPTVQMPFPDAAAMAQEVGANTRPVGAGSPVTVAVPLPGDVFAMQSAPAGAAAAAGPAVPARPNAIRRISATLAGVRKPAFWKRSIPAALFFGIVTLLVLGLVAIGVLTWAQRGTPAVDRSAEARVAKERRLRLEGNVLLQQGRINDAYARFSELNRVSPGSPYVLYLLQRLDSVRVQEDKLSSQKIAAKQKFDAGFALLNEQKYAEAIPLLQEALALDPTSEAASAALKQAQDAQQKPVAVVENKTTKPKKVVPPVTATTTTAVATDTVDASSPAQLTTAFTSPFTDGYIMVKVGSDTVAHENLWEEKGRLMFKRRAPRVVNVTREFPPKNADLQVWIVVPSLNIQEHHVIQQNFKPASSHRLQVSYDAATRKFDYRFE